MVKVGRKCSEYSMITFFTSENSSNSKFNVKRVVIFNSSSTIAAFLWKPPTSRLGQSLCDHGLMQNEKYTTLWQSPDHRMIMQMHVFKVVSEYIWLKIQLFNDLAVYEIRNRKTSCSIQVNQQPPGSKVLSIKCAKTHFHSQSNFLHSPAFKAWALVHHQCRNWNSDSRLDLFQWKHYQIFKIFLILLVVTGQQNRSHIC
jgi:hypothetical protein